jgi:hypothetical protein
MHFFLHMHARVPQFACVYAVEVADEENGVLRKRKFRSRAHANPLADPAFEYPVSREFIPAHTYNNFGAFHGLS